MILHSIGRQIILFDSHTYFGYFQEIFGDFRSISSLLAVLKFCHLIFDLFLLVIQAEISFNESTVFTCDLCNL